MYYAGIGSRETPKLLIPVIDKIVDLLNKKKYILRSGGANGADKFFEKNAKFTEIFLPWEKYNNNQSMLYDINWDQLDFAEEFYPNLKTQSRGVQALMIRNCNIILGENLNSPVEFIVCWTKDGKATGGTGQALRIAKKYNIPIYNLFYDNILWKLTQQINKNSLF